MRRSAINKWFLRVLCAGVVMSSLLYSRISAHGAVVPTHSAQYRVIIFDLGEVVFTSKSRSYISKFFGNHFQQKLMQFLHEASYDLAAHDATMVPTLPTLLANWLTGMSGTEAQAHIVKYLKESNYSYLTSKFWLVLSQYIFDTSMFLSSIKLVEPVADIIRAFKEQGYQLYVLSNWDHVSFADLHERHADLFALFDGIMISGYEGIGKPNEQIYVRFLKRYGLEPSECVFIDDLKDNVQVARSVGMCALQMSSYERLLEDLELVGLVAGSGAMSLKGSRYF